jgi:hypothetical protein
MNTETVHVVRITAQEIKEKFDLKGDIIAFSTPTKQNAEAMLDKQLLIKLVVGKKKKSKE